MSKPDASAWWALVMGAAASIEDAANCLRDPDAKKQADGAAKHYREAAQRLMAAHGVTATEQRSSDSMGKLISALEFVIRHSDSLTPSDIQRMQAILAEVGDKQ